MEAKFHEFPDELQEIALTAKALSHPARIAIISHLSKQEHCQTGDLSQILPLSRTTVFQHLKALKDLGFVQGEIVGSQTKYCLNKEKIEPHFQNLLHFLNNALQVKANCC